MVAWVVVDNKKVIIRPKNKKLKKELMEGKEGGWEEFNKVLKKAVKNKSSLRKRA